LVSENCEDYVLAIAAPLGGQPADSMDARIHKRDCFNLDPAAEAMKPHGGRMVLEANDPGLLAKLILPGRGA
jgi:hypothetical protein